MIYLRFNLMMGLGMKNICVLMILFLGFPAWAADDGAYVSLFEGTAAAKPESKTIKKDKKEDDGGLFSFLNFKFGIKKEDIPVSEDGKSLSQMEQAIRLADKGNVNAQLALGYLYLYGNKDVTPDHDKAFEYYAKAAMQNDPVGLNNLGSLYYNGIGIKRNTAKAAVLFEKSAVQGNAEAAVNLGFILISGNGVKTDAELAMKMFKQAAAAKNPTAQFMVGYAQYRGKLQPLDYDKAAKNIRAAANAKYDEAQYILALMYLNGLGLPQNYGNAVKNLKLAAAQGHVGAMLSLGEILTRGEKYGKDPYTAHIMLNLAAVRGSKDAAVKRNQLGEKLKIEELLQAQSDAEHFKETPSELTSYIRQTFGRDTRGYIDNTK